MLFGAELISCDFTHCGKSFKNVNSVYLYRRRVYVCCIVAFDLFAVCTGGEGCAVLKLKGLLWFACEISGA